MCHPRPHVISPHYKPCTIVQRVNEVILVACTGEKK